MCHFLKSLIQHPWKMFALAVYENKRDITYWRRRENSAVTLHPSVSWQTQTCLRSCVAHSFYNSQGCISRVRNSLKIASPVFIVCPRGHTILPQRPQHPRGRYTFLWSACIPGYLQKNNVAKGDCRDGVRGRDLSKGGLEERRKMYKRTDAGRFVSWNGVASFSAVAKKSSRTSCISFFPSSLGRVTSYTRETHTGWLKTDRCSREERII